MPGMPHKAHHCNQCQQRAEQQFERNHTLLFGAAGVISLQPELIRLYFNVVLCDCQDGVEGGQRLAVQDGRFCSGLPVIVQITFSLLTRKPRSSGPTLVRNTLNRCRT